MSIDIKLSNRVWMMILTMMMVGIIIYVYHDFILLKKLLLFKDIGSDTVNTFLPRWVLVADYLRNEGVPMWSFQQGMGQNIFPFKLGNPFNLIIYSLGRDHLAYGLVYIEIFKIMLGGILFYLYLRTMSITPSAAVIGGLSYSFAGYMILGGQWFVFSTEAVYMAFTLLAFERYYLRNNYVLIPIAVALIASAQPFHLYTFSIVMLVYIVIRVFDEEGINIKRLLSLYVKLAVLMLLGLSLSSVFLLSNLQEMLESSRVSGTSSKFSDLASTSILGLEELLHYVSVVLRLFSSDLMGTGSDFKGWYNYLESPMFYCGIFNLIMAPQVFAMLGRQKRILYGLLVFLVVIPIIFPYFRYIFWAFSGNYYRIYSLFVLITLLYFSVKALSNISKGGAVNITVLLLTAGFLIALLVSAYIQDLYYVNPALLGVICVYIIVYAFLLSLSGSQKYKQYVYIILLVVICSELGYMSSLSVNGRPVITASEYSSRTGFNDSTMEAIEYLKEIDDGFYRIEKTYSSGPTEHASLNDALIQGYYGSSTYYSFNQPAYVRFLVQVGVIEDGNETQSRWIGGVGTEKLLLPFSSVKYLLVKRYTYQPGIDQMFDKIKTINDVAIYKAKYYLPLGFTYDSYIGVDEFSNITRINKEIALLRALVVESEDHAITTGLIPYDIDKIGKEYNLAHLAKDISERSGNVMEMSEYTENYIRGTLSLNKTEVLFLSIPYDKGWSAIVDGSEVEVRRVNIGFSGIKLDAGKHTIELIYRPGYLLLGAAISIASIAAFLLLVWLVRNKHPVAQTRIIRYITNAKIVL